MSLPEPFGWKTSWISVRSNEAETLVSQLQLVNVRRCDWEQGLRKADEGAIFVCPPASGWTLIVGLTLPDASNEETLPLIVRLSETYQLAQYFANHRIVDYYAWARAEGGRLIRAYAFCGSQLSVPWDRGELTREEKELGLIFDDLTTSGVKPNLSDAGPERRPKFPKERHVFELARKWSIDPTQIEEYEVRDSLGILGYPESQL